MFQKIKGIIFYLKRRLFNQTCRMCSDFYEVELTVVHNKRLIGQAKFCHRCCMGLVKAFVENKQQGQDYRIMSVSPFIEGKD